MHSFKDVNGKDYPLTLTVGAFQRVKEKAGVSLDALMEGEDPLVLRLDQDLSLFGSVLNALTGVDLEAMNGQSLGQARLAFWGALSDFFRDAGLTEMVAVIEIPKEARRKIVAKLASPNTSTGSPA